MAVATFLTPKTRRKISLGCSAQAVGGIRGDIMGLGLIHRKKNENSCTLENVTGFHCQEEILVKKKSKMKIAFSFQPHTSVYGPS